MSIACQIASVTLYISPICKWIENKGGPTKITVPNIFELVDAYIGVIIIDFYPTIPEIMGCVDYYLGFIDSGNMKTGCVY